MTGKQNNKHLFNPKNERIEYKYRQHVRRVLQRDEKTVLAALKNIRDYEFCTSFAGFEKFNSDVADKYIKDMFNRGLSLSYITDNLRALKEFLRWLERQRGYRSKIDYNHIDYLNVTSNQSRAAKAVQYQKSYKFKDIIATIRQMPDKTDKQRRDRAIVSLQALCALRVSELRTVKMQNLIDEDGHYFIHVTPKDMAVKFAKTRYVNFIPLPDDIIKNVTEWAQYLKSLGFKGGDPLFPVVDNRFGQKNLLEQSIRKAQIKSDTTIRDVFKKAFVSAGFEYIKPHSFRKTIALFAQNQSPAFLNAVRQNLGHDSIDTTLSSYGQLSVVDQRKAINSVAVLE